ncbi:unnamed protein product [Amoebophrya sp. A25]|nr:unnamed protein product [Amoebophrya sp. A25]|eukprot:GSA25T00017743001.1
MSDEAAAALPADADNVAVDGVESAAVVESSTASSGVEAGTTEQVSSTQETSKEDTKAQDSCVVGEDSTAAASTAEKATNETTTEHASASQVDDAMTKNLLSVITTQAENSLREETEVKNEPGSPSRTKASKEGKHSQEEWVAPGYDYGDEEMAYSPHDHDDREVQMYATGVLDHKRKRPVYEIPEPAIARKMLPGPTKMQTLSQFKRGPKYTMGMKSQFGDPIAAVDSGTPAPGTYIIKDTSNSKVKVFPHISFGKGRRFPRSIGQGPAPGDYDPVSQLSSSYRVTFGNAPRDKGGHSHREPGPGTYEFRSTVGNGPRFTARGRKAFATKEKTDLTPGPGAYSVPSLTERGVRCGFGTSTRDSAGKLVGTGRMGNPGPGAYNLKSTLSEPRVTLTGRMRDVGNIDHLMTPGPGQYNVHCSSFGY